ncbi:putative inactive receptor kinase [Apostasia shenzhenica]|uniref:Putative inactive receptor kinase n=1 Tax=Apostasia shenzhenica TaxID=1088818 RepID=A0A2H9ZXY2_9ASPA|nr:putative inactive receptor kinase [Apostasia shenzhenica]
MRLIILSVLLWLGTAKGNSVNSDIDALLEFKNGIIRDPSVHILDSWVHFSSPASEGCPLNWYGVQCNGNRVSSITLNDLNLRGNISFSSLSRMNMLQNFSLANNQLTGVLSPELGSLTSLEYLDLSRNSFLGKMPDELMDIRSLVFLNLSCNGFGSLMPSGFRKLQKLQYLDLRGNRFSGDVGSILDQLQVAVYVDLSDNRFTGSLSSIADNSSVIGSLQYLNISHNGLSGQLFGSELVPLFDSLEVFDASFNQLTGQVPSFNFIVSLKILHLGNNQFSGSFPEAFFKDFSMVFSELDLSFNKLTGPLPSITSTSLMKLNLSANKLTGSLPTKIGSCLFVDLSNNMFSGNVSSIRSWGNYVETVELSSNKLTGTLPRETSQFLRLKSLKVSNNLLEGEVPPVLGTYPEINVIDLSVNHLHGSLPETLFLSSRLMDVNLSCNHLTGAIFQSKRQPTNSSLVSIDLSNNFLSGSLSEEIAAMGQLVLLNFSRNNISGEIPNAIGFLHHLLYVDLSHNQFEGNIPDNLPESLLGINVSYNNLSGNVPKNLFRFPNSSFLPGNDLLNFPPASSNSMSAAGKAKQSRRMRNAIIYSLIAGGFVFAAIFLLFVLVYHRGFNGNDRGNTTQKKSSFSLLFGTRKRNAPPQASTRFSQDHLSQSSTLSSQRRQGIALETEMQELEVCKSPMKNDRKASVSFIISSPSSIHQSSGQQTSVLSVSSPDRLAGDLHLFDNSISFTVEELSRAPAEIIGRSCHGSLYMATLDKGHVLAVKWLKEGIVKSKKEFSREAKKLGTMRHPNLISLKGYYWGPKEHERLLISDFVASLSLTVHLSEYEQRNLHPLSLSERLTIAIDIARCLNYLHNERSIPHGNLKSTNILVQSPNSNALLTDYSLHRIMTPAGMADQVLNAGALGYRPPEFASSAKPCPSLKSDIYAFGVILLELVTGRNAGEIVSGNPVVVDLTDWVRLMASENRSYECFDKNIFSKVEEDEDPPPRVLEKMLAAALRCISSADERPEIRTVFEDLSSLLM